MPDDARMPLPRRHFPSRIKDLRKGSPVPLEFIGAVPGDVRYERELHERFAALRRRGEWFDDTEELRSAIAELLARNGIEFDA